MRPALAALLATAVLSAPAPAQEPSGGAKVYKQAIHSVVWIKSDRRNGYATGSGSLVDRANGLILTNYHVVEDNNRATVFFPEFRDGQPVPERGYYSDRGKRLGIPGEVIARSQDADLAVIRVRPGAVPRDADGIKLAGGSPAPGEAVHAIGNAGASGALWGYVRGTVRQVYRKRWQAEVGRRVLTFQAKVIETDSPTNPGDSGGPLLNDAGELVGVTQGGAIKANSVSTFVDVSEVKQLLNSRAVRDARAGDRPAADRPPPPARRTAATQVTDTAKLFSPDAVAAANKTLSELHGKGLDLLIETYPTAPDTWRDKAKKSDPEGRRRLFNRWASDRRQAEKVDGLSVVICLDPPNVAVHVPEKWEAKLPAGFARQLGDALVAALRDKKYDAALEATVRMTTEALAAGGKK
ncbi:MAG: trypsin-like peptidase domain-containing protein [Gemmataceae bacterium]